MIRVKLLLIHIILIFFLFHHLNCLDCDAPVSPPLFNGRRVFCEILDDKEFSKLIFF